MNTKLTLEQAMADREALAYSIMTSSRGQMGYAVESVDPDWTDHYHGELDLAFRDYWEGAKEEMIESLVESLK